MSKRLMIGLVASIGSLLVVLWALLSFTATEQNQTAEVSPAEEAANLAPLQPIHQVEGINEYRLANGLKVLLFPDPTKETVTVNVTYKVGSKNENYGETGMAHLLEHLLFKGSEKHRDIPAELSAHGAKPNGTTWIDRTNYFETFAATEENIDWALSLESDRMVNSFIAREDLDSEMTVVRNEFERSENSPFRVLLQAILSASYEWHNNGKPTIGARSDIENVSIERLQAFYRLYYQPDNAVLVVAGKFDEQNMLDKIQNTFGKIKKPTRTLPHLYTDEPAADGEKSVTIRRVGDMQIYASAYHIPAGYHEDYAAIEMANSILADTPRGRLHKNVTEKKLAVGTYGFPFQLQDPGILFFAAQVALDGDLGKARDAFIETIENVNATPFTQEELDTARLKYLKNFEQAFNSPETIAIELSEYIGMGDWRLLFLTRDRIEALTLEQVQAAAETYLQQNNRTDGTFLPTEQPARIEIPVAQSVSEMLEGYEGKEAVAMGEAFDPSFSNIKSRTSQHTLKNGIDVSLLPKKSRGEEVVVHFAFHFGDENSLQGQRVSGGLAPAMLMRGTTKYSRQELQNELDKLKSSMDVQGGVTAISGSITSKKDNVEPAVELLAHVLSEPAFDKKEFELLVDANVAGLEANRQDPQARASWEIRRYNKQQYGKEHPFYMPTLEEAIESYKSASLDSVKSFYKTFFGVAKVEITVVGDFNPETMLAKLESTFGSWQNKAEFTRIAQTFKSFEPVDTAIDTPDKESAALMALLPLPIGDSHADAPALEMGVYILGGGFLNSRLATRIRQKDGLSYGVGAWLNLDEQDAIGNFGYYAIFAPQNLSAVETGLREEIQKVIDSGFTESELEEAKSGLLQKAKVNRAEAHTMAWLINTSMFTGRDLMEHAEYEEKIRALTIDDVHKAFVKHIKPENIAVVKAGDFSKEQ